MPLENVERKFLYALFYLLSFHSFLRIMSNKTRKENLFIFIEDT